MECPRCRTNITSPPVPGTFVLCPGCGARLGARLKAGPAPPAAAPPEGNAPPVQRGPDESDPSSTQMFVPSKSLRQALGGESPPDVGAVEPAAPAPPAPAAVAPSEAPGAQTVAAWPRTPPAPAETPVAPPAEGGPVDLLSEIRAIRLVQERMLQVLEELHGRLGGVRGGAPNPVGEAAEATASGDMLAFPPEPVRSRRRKKVLLIDDGRVDAEAAAKALKKADIPVRTASDAKAALAAMGEDKPDVIVLEPHLGGGAGAKEFVRALKANVEWAGIPVVLHAAGSTASMEEAKLHHGADEIVLKGPRGDEALVSQVITLFRRR